MRQQNLRTIFLTICCLSYLLVGAAIFSALEYDEDQVRRHDLKLHREFLMQKYNISKADIKVWESFLLAKANVEANLYQWSFAGSVYFATTVITTIGYGHTVPKTQRGKIFCMLYAAVGIPLALTMFQSIGERLNSFLASMFRRLKRKMGKNDKDVSSTTNLVVICGLLSMAITVSSGAFIYRYYEKWDYFDSLYYCFITVTTIGFGDYVALQDPIDHRYDNTYVGISLLFIFFGLTIVGSVMNQLALRLLTASQTKEPVENLVHGGPRCERCSIKSTQEQFDCCDQPSDYSTTLLRNYEDEITFTTYKEPVYTGADKKRASV